LMYDDLHAGRFLPHNVAIRCSNRFGNNNNFLNVISGQKHSIMYEITVGRHM